MDSGLSLEFIMPDFTAPEDEALFAAIGRLTISWAHIDFALEGIVEVFFHRFGNPPGEVEQPHALKRKLIYIKKSLKAAVSEEDTLRKWIQIIEAIQLESDVRHDIIHGAVIAHTSGSGRAEFARFIRSSAPGEWRKREFTTKEIIAAAVKANKLATPLMRLLRSLQQIESKE